MVWKLALVFGIFLLIDILGHICLKIRRKIFEWFVLAAVTLGMVGMVVTGIVQFLKKAPSDDSAVYMSYCYLMDENAEMARVKMVGAGEGLKKQTEIMDIFASMVSRDYMQGYFKIGRLLSTTGLKVTDRGYLEELQTICMRELGIDDEIAENNVNDYGVYLEQLSAKDNSATGNSQAVEDTKKILRKYVETLQFSDKEIQEYTKEYELDSKLNATAISTISLEDIEELKEKFGKKEDVLRLQCKYYVSQRDYENAKKAAEELVKKYRNEENYVIYTDIIAQQAYEKEKLNVNADVKYNLEDKEVKSIIDKADKKTQQAEKLKEQYDEEDEEIQNKIDKLLAEAEGLYKEANYVTVKRAINYILAKKPSKGDYSGIYDLQLAKLYLVTGDRDKAKKYLYQVIDNSVDIRDSSAIKEALNEVVGQYNRITDDEFNAELNRAINELIQAQSNDVVPSNEETINGSFESYVKNSLKYDKINIHISRIVTKKYPEIRAYININGYKDGSSELASDFKKDDFILIDTQYEITDFELVKNTDEVSIALVMDRSGSMEGSPVANAKAAAIEAVNHMDTKTEKLAIISYNSSASLDQGLTNRPETLKRVINDIHAGGDTNISAGLKEAIREIKSEEGIRAVILMSDGRDGGSEYKMQEAVDEAISEEIAVYTVAFGDCDDEYMKSIADATGGKFIKASDSAELSDIYLTLQRYIVNNYCIEYKVDKNPETDPRFLTVNIGKYHTSATKEYYLKEKNKTDSEKSIAKIEKTEKDAIAVASISPGKAFTKAIDKGIEVQITGNGFNENVSVSIGNLVLKNIKVESKNSLTGTLQGRLEPGVYDVYVKTPEGKLAIGDGLFHVFKPGTATSIRLGCTTITADSIAQSDASHLIASGNVMINGFVHSAGDMEIAVNNMDPSIELKENTCIYVGDSGNITGNSKLYISYEQMKETGGRFASLVMAGKDYVIQNDRYAASIDKSSASFDETIGNYNLSIPFIMDIDVAEVNLYHNRLQVDIKTFNLKDITSNVDDALKHKTGANASKITSRSSLTNKFDIRNAGDLALSMALTPDGIHFGGEVTINVNDSVNFGTFYIKEVSLKLNSLDADNQYWKIAGKVDFSKLIPGLGVTGLDGSLSSYYWLPDSLSLDASLYPGLVAFKIIDINKVGGSMQGISTILLKAYEHIVSPETYKILGTDIQSDAYNYQDIILQAKAEGEANLFASFNSKNALFKKFKEWGEIGKLNGSAGINFSKPEFVIKADMSLLGSEKASAEATIGASGLNIKGSVDLKLSGFGVELEGGGEAALGGNLTSAYVKVGVNGSAKCALLKVNAKGDVSVQLDFDWDFDMAKITLNYKDGSVDKEGSIWYEENGSLFLWDKIHVSSN